MQYINSSGGKKVYIIRHGKTEDGTYEGKKDYDRVLTERGKSDVRLIAQNMQEKGIMPDLIIASTAYRAANTAAIIAGQLGYNASQIQWEPDLYLCQPATIEAVLQSVGKEDVKVIFVVAHNMGVTAFVNEKIAAFAIDNVPTSGVVGFELPIGSWDMNNRGVKGTFLYLDYPGRQQQSTQRN